MTPYKYLGRTFDLLKLTTHLIHLWWLWPVWIALSLAVLVGILDAQQTIRLNDYVTHHLYNTASQVLVRSIDAALIFALIPGIAWLALRFSRSVRGICGILIRFGLAAAIVVSFVWIPVAHEYLFEFADAIPTNAIVRNPQALNKLLRNALVPIFTPLSAMLMLTLFHQSQLGSRRGKMKTGIWRCLRPAGIFTTVSLITAFLAVHLFAGVCRADRMAALKDKPNVIVIMMDAARADHFGCYGYEQQKSTTNIDLLARQSTRFDLAYSQSSWTLWSLSSFMTSKYPETLGFAVNGVESPDPGRLNDHCLTLAELLKDAGYKTAGLSTNPNFSPEVNNTQGMDYYAMIGGCSGMVTSEAEAWIRKNESDKFFMFLLYADPHDPYQWHPQFDFTPDSYKGRFKESCAPSDGKHIIDALAQDPVELKQAVTLYDAEIAFTDDAIGHLIDFLKHKGLYDNTLIVLMADHGEGFNEHDYFLHCAYLYDDVVRVPFIVKSPNQYRRSTIDRPFPLINMFPSIVKAIGYEVPSNLDGNAVDFRKTTNRTEPAIFGAADWFEPLRYILAYPYKLIHRLDTKQDQLFDLATDPGEQHDISTIEKDKVQELRSILLNHVRKETSLTSTSAGAANFTDQQKQALRSLGYLH